MKIRFFTLILFPVILIPKLIFSQACLQANAGYDQVICPAGGSVTLGTPGVPGYQYSWNPTTGLNNPNIAQPIATPPYSTTYTLTVTQGQNLIQNGDFENGYSGFGTDYPVYPATIDPYLGTQLITTNPSNMFGSWCSMPDHTPSGTNMLAMDAPILNNPLNYRFWFQTIAVQPSTNYTFAFWAASTYYPSDIRATLSGNASTASIADLHIFTTCGTWQQFQIQWNSGSSTQLTLDMRYLPSPPGTYQYYNDLAIDDITFTSGACPITSDQVAVCVCETTPPPETVTVQIPIGSVVTMEKYNRELGQYCFDLSSSGLHYHYPYVNGCNSYGGLLSGFLQADNGLPASQSFDVEFRLYPKHNGVLAYLDFLQNNLSIYDFCRQNDIVNAKIKFSHRSASYPICGRGQSGSEFNLLQPHYGNNPFTVKRTSSIKNHWFTCSTHDFSVYNFDNPPIATTDIISVSSSSSPYQDYLIDVTQMVKNSLNISSNSSLGFLIQQSQNSNYNNVFFEGVINSNTDTPVPGASYIELTYVRRKLPQGCSIAKNNLAEKQPANFAFSTDSFLEQTKVSPNPSKSSITISSPSFMTGIEFYNSVGLFIKGINVLNQKNIILNTESLPNGLYFIKIKSVNRVETVKHIINH